MTVIYNGARRGRSRTDPLFRRQDPRDPGTGEDDRDSRRLTRLKLVAASLRQLLGEPCISPCRRAGLSAKSRIRVRKVNMEMPTPTQLFERDIERAAQLPLPDAAYHLWVRKRELDALENEPETKYPTTTEMMDTKIFTNTLRSALAEILHARTVAHKGSTFRRLKKAHPSTTDQDLEEAIKRAVSLDTNYLKYYKANRNTAVEVARKENPGFQEATYQRANSRAAFDMAW